MPDDTATANDPRAAHDKLWDLIRGIRFGMLTSRTAQGHLTSRPLTTQNRSLDAEADNSLWFFVSRSSEVAEEVAADGEVNVAYADPDKDCYVSVCGTVRLVDDPARVQALWSMQSKAWFPGGPTDPGLQLLQVRIGQAEYWDVKSNKVTQLLKMARAAMTGEPPRGMAEHRKLD